MINLSISLASSQLGPAVWGRQARPHPAGHPADTTPHQVRPHSLALVSRCLRLTLRLNHVENACSAAAWLHISAGRVRFGQRRRRRRRRRLWQHVRSSFCGCGSGWGRRSAPRQLGTLRAGLRAPSGHPLAGLGKKLTAAACLPARCRGRFGRPINGNFCT